jgi:hypothetical protein
MAASVVTNATIRHMHDSGWQIFAAIATAVAAIATAISAGIIAWQAKETRRTAKAAEQSLEGVEGQSGARARRTQIWRGGVGSFPVDGP